MPDYLKAPGIGDSVSKDISPATYNTDSFLKPILTKREKEVGKVIAVKQWHNRMFKKEREAHPKRFPQYPTKIISPGPG
jgi:hypothetical protein